MNINKIILLTLLSTVMVFTSCKSLSKTQKGTAIGTASGAGAGAVVGRAAGNTAMGAIIGAVVGGVTGAVIGNKMDKQAADIKKEIPGVTVERVGEGIVLEFKDNILFGFDRYKLNEEAKLNLNKLVAILNKYPDTDIEIYGHTDSKGTLDYNQTLSTKRATTVSRYLASSGIEIQRLTAKGYGENFPKYDNDTEEGRSKNRRVEFAITANDNMIMDIETQNSKEKK